MGEREAKGSPGSVAVMRGDPAGSLGPGKRTLTEQLGPEVDRARTDARGPASRLERGGDPARPHGHLGTAGSGPRRAARCVDPLPHRRSAVHRGAGQRALPRRGVCRSDDHRRRGGVDVHPRESLHVEDFLTTIDEFRTHDDGDEALLHWQLYADKGERGPQRQHDPLRTNKDAYEGPRGQRYRARGVATASGALPHGDRIQRLFGRHDISQIKAHTGDAAARSAQDMGAAAYATGDHVVLGAGADLHTVAHEAAHVVQQRGGVQLKGGVGEAGDPYERQADAVADRVVRGESAEALLDESAQGAAPGQAPSEAMRGARDREPEPEEAAVPVQLRVSSRAKRGTRIVISNRRAGDYREHGRVLRPSHHRDDCLVVEFDNERGVGYRVDCDDMDYEDDSSSDSESDRSPPPQARRPASSPSDALWVATGQPHHYENCAHFALQNFDLAAEGSVAAILGNLHVLNMQVTTNHSEAVVVFYGRGGAFSHVIRKVNGHWEEVQFMGGPHRRYTGNEDPPRGNRGDDIVLMLR